MCKIYDCNTVYYSYKLLPNMGISHMIFVAGGFASFSFNCTHSVILRLPLKISEIFITLHLGRGMLTLSVLYPDTIPLLD